MTPRGVRDGGMTPPRCIAIHATGVRCVRPASIAADDLYVCSRHATMWTMLLIEDHYSPPTRKVLAFAQWETVAEGQRLV